MKVTINNTLYNFDFTGQLGAYYTYEVTFGTGFIDDAAILSHLSSMRRLAYAIIKTDNPDLTMTFSEFNRNITDEVFTDCVAYINKRYEIFKEADNAAHEDESDADDESKNH